jgi:hypothetical protein
MGRERLADQALAGGGREHVEFHDCLQSLCR